MTAAATLTDASFLNATSIETRRLSGQSNTIVLGANAANAGLVNVTTGSGTTSITDWYGVTLNVNATALANNTALTLAGSAAETVTGLIGNITAGALSGTLSVTTGDASDNTITITTGSAATAITDNFSNDVVTVNATALAQNTTTDAGRLSRRDSHRAGRQPRGWFADRGAERDRGECDRRQYNDHDWVGGNLGQRERDKRCCDG